MRDIATEVVRVHIELHSPRRQNLPPARAMPHEPNRGFLDSNPLLGCPFTRPRRASLRVLALTLSPLLQSPPHLPCVHTFSSRSFPCPQTSHTRLILLFPVAARVETEASSISLDPSHSFSLHAPCDTRSLARLHSFRYRRLDPNRLSQSIAAVLISKQSHCYRPA